AVRARVDDLERQLAARDAATHALDAMLAQSRQEREAQEVALSEAVRRADSHAATLHNELVERTRQRDDLQQSLAETCAQLQNALTEAGTLRAEVHELREQLSALDELAVLRRRCAAAEAAAVAVEAERERLRQAVDAAVEEHDTLSAQVRRLEEAETHAAEERRARADQSHAARQELEHLHGIRARLEEQLTDARHALDACRAASQQIAGRVAAAERAAQVAAAQHRELQEQVCQHQHQLRDDAARLAAVGADLEQERREGAALQRALDDLRAR